VAAEFAGNRSTKWQRSQSRPARLCHLFYWRLFAGGVCMRASGYHFRLVFL